MKSPCEICGSLTPAISYRCFCCSSCQMFFRRNYALWPNIECRYDGKCDLRNSPNRRRCRACRLKACRELGLRMSGKSLIIQQGGNTDEEKDKSSPQPNLDDATELLNSLPLLKAAYRACRTLLERQFYLSSVHMDRPLMDDGPSTSVHMLNTEFRAMETRVLRLACIGVAEWLNSFGQLTVEEKTAVIKDTVMQVSLINKFHMTAQRFPDVGDSRLALFVGYHVDRDNFASFLVDLEEENANRYKQFVTPLLAVCVEVTDRFRRFQPTSVEASALTAIMICDKLERMNIMPEIASKMHDELCSQHFVYLSKTYSTEVAAARLSRLNGLLSDVNAVLERYVEMYSMLGVFLPDFRDEYWVQRPDVSEAFIIGCADGVL